MRDDRSRIGDFALGQRRLPRRRPRRRDPRPRATRQVRALFVTGGNPLITMPNAGRLRDALRAARAAGRARHLPQRDRRRSRITSCPARRRCERARSAVHLPADARACSRGPICRRPSASCAPDGEQRDEATIYLDLARACGVDALRLARRAARARDGEGGCTRAAHPGEQPAIPQELLLSLLLRVTGQGSFKRAARARRTACCGRRIARDDFLGQRVRHRRRQGAPGAAAAAGAGARSSRRSSRASRRRRGRLKLITKRAVNTHNSWTHNDEEFVVRRARHQLPVRPPRRRGARSGSRDGDLADVTTDDRDGARAGAAARRSHARHRRAAARLGAPARHAASSVAQQDAAA